MNHDIVVDYIKKYFGTDEFIPLHSPHFIGNEKEYVCDCIDTTLVSSVGSYVNKFEVLVADYVGAQYAIATVNGTAALHVALLLAGVQADEEVVTQAISFVATANAITYCGAKPVFLDCDRIRLGMSAEALEEFLSVNTRFGSDGSLYNKQSGKRIRACLPVHVMGHPVDIVRIRQLCQEYNLVLVEDAAESLGSFVAGCHTGNFGTLSAFSFNGNKIVTTGGGGVVVTNDKELAAKAKHITTTAKVNHPWEYVHDAIAFNYRMPNLNAALGCAQIEFLPKFLEKKRALSLAYQEFFSSMDVTFVSEPTGCKSNYWLNAILLNDRKERDAFLDVSNKCGVMTRPLWRLLPQLPVYSDCQTDGLLNAKWLQDRLVNIPSSPRL